MHEVQLLSPVEKREDGSPLAFGLMQDPLSDGIPRSLKQNLIPAASWDGLQHPGPRDSRIFTRLLGSLTHVCTSIYWSYVGIWKRKWKLLIYNRFAMNARVFRHISQIRVQNCPWCCCCRLRFCQQLRRLIRPCFCRDCRNKRSAVESKQ